MGFIKNRVDIRNETVYTLQDQELLKLLGLDVDALSNNKLSETTYFVCLNHLSQRMSTMPYYLYKDADIKGKEKIKQTYFNNLLNREPNPYYTASTLWGSVELNKLHYGNAYVYIEAKGGRTKHLWLLPSDNVTIYVDNGGIFGKYNALWYVWTDSKTGKQYSFSAEEILHFKTHMSFDGISGMATKDILKTQIESLQYSQQYQGKLFKNNLFGGKIILQYTDNMNTTGKDLLIKETERYANSVGSGKFLPIPLGIQASTLDMKLSDAEFVELNKLNTLQLASAFGIKPNILNDYSKSSYSNSETQQLDFYVNSLQPIFNMYQQEITRKLLSPSEKNKNYFFEIDKEILFELDKSTQMEVLNKGVNNFMITPNEAREKLGLPWVDGGDELVGNGNYIKLSQVGTQWNNANLKGGDKIEK